jgi:two-component system, NarL family, sensor kinase
MGAKEILAVALIVVVVFSILSTAIILFVIVYNKSQQLHEETLKSKILDSEIKTYETTVQNISREIHDNIGYDLNIVRTLLNNPIEIDHYRLISKLDEALSKLQNISRSLNAHHISEFDLIETLHKEFDFLSNNHSVKFKLQTYSNHLIWNAFTQLNLFRICQEAISNAIKHSGASQIIIEIKQLEYFHLISISDNGNGVQNLEVFNKSNGLINMKERSDFINAKLDFESLENIGTTVKISVPIQ